MTEYSTSDKLFLILECYIQFPLNAVIAKLSTSEEVQKAQTKIGTKCENFSKFFPKAGSTNYRNNYAKITFFHHKNFEPNEKSKEI